MTAWLIDKSALVRLAASPDAGEWAARIERGVVRITPVTRLEVGFSARSADDLRSASSRPPLSSMPVEYLTPAIEDRAVLCRPCSRIEGSTALRRWRTYWWPPLPNSPN